MAPLPSLGRLLGRAAPAETGERLAPGHRIYAVGDIHGHLPLLEKLADAIRGDLADRPVEHSIEVFLGDYVDRGPQSAQVIDWLVRAPLLTGRRVCLRGNHEDFLLTFLQDHDLWRIWGPQGGLETVASYGVRVRHAVGPDDMEALRDTFFEAIPPAHLAFLLDTAISFEEQGYFFAHAGARPGIPLSRQSDQDHMWIREPFLSSDWDFGKVIVHGHTPHEQPEVTPRRINVDTGAYMTGRLTCAVLEGDDVSFLSACRD